MFSYQKVHELNRLELIVYKYIIGHTREVQDMTIREMANAAHVSTTTILRFLKKMDYSGFSEFKFALKQSLKQPSKAQQDPSMEPIKNFFQLVADEEPFDNKIEQAAI